jgi:hypothetical protein
MPALDFPGETFRVLKGRKSGCTGSIGRGGWCWRRGKSEGTEETERHRGYEGRGNRGNEGNRMCREGHSNQRQNEGIVAMGVEVIVEMKRA